jgi:hypothetical protein
MQVKPNYTMNVECGQAFKTLEDLVMHNREAHVDGTTAATIGQAMQNNHYPESSFKS